MLGRALLTAAAISYVLCVLVLSGVNKGDLDASLMGKLQRYNININDLSDEKLQQDCLSKTESDFKETEQNEGKQIAKQNEGKETDTNQKEIQLTTSTNEHRKVRENGYSKEEPSGLEAMVKYLKDKVLGTTEVSTYVTESTIAKEKHLLTREDIEKIAETLTKQSSDRSDNKVLSSERALKYWRDILNKNEQKHTDENAKIPKMQPSFENILPKGNDAITQENFESTGTKLITQMLLDRQHAQVASDNFKNLKDDSVIQAMNQFLRHDRIVPVNTDISTVDNLTIPHMEYFPHILERQMISPETTFNNDHPNFLRSDGLYSPKGLLDYENYDHFRSLNENFDSNLVKPRYNHYIRDEPAHAQETKTPERYFETMDSTRTLFADAKPEGKEMKLSQDMIRQIAESVKDIVLRDLKKDLITDTTRTTSPKTTQTLDYSTSSPIVVQNSDKSTEIKSSPATKDSQMEKKMAKIVAILNEMKSIRDGTPQNVAKSVENLDKKTDPTRTPVRTDVRRNYKKDPPQFIDIRNRPELMPIMVRGQHTNQNIITPQQLTPAEMLKGPILIQTNLDQIPPLTVPLLKTDLMNINIVVTTESPFIVRHASQNKLIPGNEFNKSQLKSDEVLKKFHNKNIIYQNDHTHNNSDCVINNNDNTLLNKTNEIVARLKYIENLFTNLQDKKISKQMDTGKYLENQTNHVDLNYFRERSKNDTINEAKVLQHSEDKKMKDEIKEAALKLIHSREIEDKGLRNAKLINHYLTDHREDKPPYENVTALIMNITRDPNFKIRNTENISADTKNYHEIDIRFKNIERDLNRLKKHVRPKNIGQHLLDDFKQSHGVIGPFNKLRPRYYQDPYYNYYIPRYSAFEQIPGHHRARNLPRPIPDNTNQSNDILTRLKNMELRMDRSRNGIYDRYEPVYRAVPQDEVSNPYSDMIPLRTTSKKVNRKVVSKHNKPGIANDNEYSTDTQENIGFHDKLQIADGSPDIKPQEEQFENKGAVAIQEAKAIDDGTNIEKLLHTQEKVNVMLERLLATQIGSDPTEIFV